MKKVSTDDLRNHQFQDAFIEYFKEFGYQIPEHDVFFQTMNNEQDNKVLAYEVDGKVIAFIMFRFERFTNWFFNEDVVFVRELWVKKSYRNKGLASKLLLEVEVFAQRNQRFKLILTTDSADDLYLKNGYILDQSYAAKNNYSVYTKNLSLR
ncbi:GNAT family N-acetyltransferase [Erysipelothrix rhusiopathiae]|uniref:GNAT family N-acetyltransferase n=1 Tax=Erysipelothrix rhusiopathiae TaxID=1648 RepID=UPI002B254963|nr:GNAT family N-acetyltransferase [Erysipelothrix rhusiopathiae]WRB92475.1 GNAT family N-acetyltransferase [Erysipelothrix rhusiopathiae]